MQYNNRNLCDFCFEEIIPGQVCPRCGLSHDTYNSADLLPVGTNLQGKYIIGRVLGRGGFGATYLAFSSALQQRVAVKEFFPNGIACRSKGEEKVSLVSDSKKDIFQKGSKRFFREAETISKFNANPNVVTVYEFFYANDTVYYSMEYLDGIDLKGYVAKQGGRISEAEAVTIMRNVCRALKDVHSTSTLHRDISPDNIFLCKDQTVKLVDFGAAKQLVGEESRSLEVVLKQGFAPPEQYSANGKQGTWTDIYALGGSIFYALTGAIPTEAMTRVDGDDGQMFERLQNVSAPLRRIIEKCMEVDIKTRFQNAVELEGALSALPVQDVPINASGYEQSIYVVGNKRTGVQGTAASAFIPGPVPGYNPMNGGYQPSQYGASYNPNPSQYPQSAYGAPGYVPPSFTPPQPYPQSRQSGGGSNNLLKGILIGVAALVIVVLIVLLVIPRQQGPGMPPPPPPGTQQMVPGQPGAPMAQPGLPMDPAQGGQPAPGTEENAG